MRSSPPFAVPEQEAWWNRLGNLYKESCLCAIFMIRTLLIYTSITILIVLPNDRRC